ncbi:hypothetical protein KM043_006130 [Ampulex compressa]|nr:hypothetical protein KM043_006130 [Ampulex compressa]
MDDVVVPEEPTGGSSILRIDSVCRRARVGRGLPGRRPHSTTLRSDSRQSAWRALAEDSGRLLLAAIRGEGNAGESVNFEFRVVKPDDPDPPSGPSLPLPDTLPLSFFLLSHGSFALLLPVERPSFRNGIERFLERSRGPMRSALAPEEERHRRSSGVGPLETRCARTAFDDAEFSARGEGRRAAVFEVGGDSEQEGAQVQPKQRYS